MRPGDLCPHCQDGALYPLGDCSDVLRLIGQPPVGGTRYELERLRCAACGKIETAELPAAAGSQKYDETVPSIIATLRYGLGMPWSRIERMQRSAGIPLPASVQWELVRDAAAQSFTPIYQRLLFEAAQGQLLHQDDTSARILELTTRLNNGEPLRADDPSRYGVFTTSILSLCDGRPPIALFFTGAKHAGENLRDLITARLAGLPPPIQMCDASTRNTPSDLQTILANCLSHGRKYFADLEATFPEEVDYVLDCLGQVYRIDGEAVEHELSPEARLRRHQQQSGPIMEGLRCWMQEQFEQKQVEPNSSLGKAISYMLKHWDALTRFLQVPGAPLDNNICERALKLAIRHRNNSRFYKTEHGARVGDLYMSLIHTCHFATADPYDYLTQLQRHRARVATSPEAWMPWSYRYQLSDTADCVPA